MPDPFDQFLRWFDEAVTAGLREPNAMVLTTVNKEVRVEGSVEKVPEEELEKFFHSRPRGSQLGAIVSKQSTIIAGREVLQQAYKELEHKYTDGSWAPVPARAATAPAVVPSASPISGASEAGGAHCPSCAVDGCKADLSKCRDYCRRHKVCETHSKTPVVVVAGREMRFCVQQVYATIPTILNSLQFACKNPQALVL
ncbi:hypothetical protein C2845_PM10G15460 [Panicum miliaceum]|uniref:SBP-type domain-containing protein n=1 Tax=Panicum miliaceum TaxID=4540 RepID=A0A3L6PFI4_PANMI|nr:hypothetical protein C2845_PM10G15460 [Panicum miliaceum]